MGSSSSRSCQEVVQAPMCSFELEDNDNFVLRIQSNQIQSFEQDLSSRIEQGEPRNESIKKFDLSEVDIQQRDDAEKDINGSPEASKMSDRIELKADSSDGSTETGVSNDNDIEDDSDVFYSANEEYGEIDIDEEDGEPEDPGPLDINLNEDMISVEQSAKHVDEKFDKQIASCTPNL